ncbi:MAG: M20/M25/M40 family metallo-hydrolase [Candidatus Aminicenantes bacterium]|nr:M20/M25/M40 family metallo-hydrolase [Candidatus Aminicenantes bacterium]
MKKAMRYSILLGLSVLLSASMDFSSSGDFLDLVRDYRISREHEIIKEFMELLSLPNVSSDRDGVRKNAEFIQKMMTMRGIETQIMETAGNPVVFGELKVSDAARTLMFYVHYDGQPVDPSKWTETHPFTPALRPAKLKAGTTEPKPIPFPGPGAKFEEDWRIYARSASDDKAPIMAILTALDAFKQAGIGLKNNLKFVFEGEEEAGSTNLRPFLEKHKDLLQCDVLFMCDGPVYYSGDPTMFFGVRGITTLEITVYGPNTSVHSGHYGNWAPNPAVRLAYLLASMRDTTGRVKIKGFYDTVVPLTDFEKKALQAVPSYENEIKENYGFSGEEKNWGSLLEAVQFPALNINGLQSGWVGAQQRTIIPPTATAAIDIRLAKGNDPEDMAQKIIIHIREQGYHVIDHEPDQKTRMTFPLIAKVIRTEEGYKAHRTSMDLPISRMAIRALEKLKGGKPVFLPSLGGSLPIHMFYAILEIPIIGISIANHDNNQHQPDENIRIGNLWQGIETFAGVLMMDEE